jgi:hypothetical protein
MSGQSNIRELTIDELAAVSGAVNLDIQADKNSFVISVNGYGAGLAAGCVLVVTPSKTVGAGR